MFRGCLYNTINQHFIAFPNVYAPVCGMFHPCLIRQSRNARNVLDDVELARVGNNTFAPCAPHPSCPHSPPPPPGITKFSESVLSAWPRPPHPTLTPDLNHVNHVVAASGWNCSDKARLVFVPRALLYHCRSHSRGKGGVGAGAQGAKLSEMTHDVLLAKAIAASDSFVCFRSVLARSVKSKSEAGSYPFFKLIRAAQTKRKVHNSLKLHIFYKARNLFPDDSYPLGCVHIRPGNLLAASCWQPFAGSQFRLRQPVAVSQFFCCDDVKVLGTFALEKHIDEERYDRTVNFFLYDILWAHLAL